MKLLAAAVAFVLGVLFGQAFLSMPPSGIEVIVGLLAAFVIMATAVYVRRYVAITVLLLLVILGIVRGSTFDSSSTQTPWGDLPRNEQQVTLEGTLLNDPAPSNGQIRLRLRIETSAQGSNSTAYIADVYTERLHDQTGSNRRSGDFRYGDHYRVSGRFILRTGSTSSGDTLGTLFTTSVDLIDTGAGRAWRSAIAELRSNVSHSLVDVLGSKTGGLAAAMLVGDRTKLLPETIEEFRASGLSHVLAISGLHIAMVGGIVMALSAWIVGRQKQFYLIAPAVTVWGYAAMAGLSPSVTRAAIMFTVYLAARLFGRQRSVLPPLALAATLMLAVDPQIIHSVSFQLSFAAVLGIAMFSARIAARGSERIESSTRIPTTLKRSLTGIVYGMSVSLSATLATAPLVAFHFGVVPVWGIPSTLLLVPVLPLFIGGSGLVAAVGALVAVPASVIGAIAFAIGSYMTFIANAFAGLPLGPIAAEGWSVVLITGWYALLFGGMNRRTVWHGVGRVIGRIRQVGTMPLAGASAGAGAPASNIVLNLKNRRIVYSAVIVWAIVAVSAVGFAMTGSGSGELVVTFFETNRGDMILLETPSGARLLIDGGDDSDIAVQNLELVLPPLDRRIDVLLSTHPDADHLGGLERVVERFDVGKIVDSGVPHNSAVYASWARLLDEIANEDDRVVTAQPDLVVALDDHVSLTVLQTSCTVVECANFNDEGVVARLDFKDVSFLLTGDMTSGGETDLLLGSKRIRSTVLKVGHHGSRTSTGAGFLDAVDPALAIVTTGIKNQFGHPHDEVLTRLHEHLNTAAVYVTRDRGTVTVTTNGKRVWVESAR